MNAREKQATDALDSKKKMMEVIEFGTNHLRLFLSVGLASSELNTVSRAVGVVVAEIFSVS